MCNTKRFVTTFAVTVIPHSDQEIAHTEHFAEGTLYAEPIPGPLPLYTQHSSRPEQTVEEVIKEGVLPQCCGNGQSC